MISTSPEKAKKAKTALGRSQQLRQQPENLQPLPPAVGREISTQKLSRQPFNLFGRI